MSDSPKPVGLPKPGKIRKITVQQAIAAYEKLGSVWAAGKELGCCGQRVHQLLEEGGHPRANRKFSEAEKERLRAEYPHAASVGEAHDLAKQMGRTPQFLCRQARALGLTDVRRKRPWFEVPSAMLEAFTAIHNDAPDSALAKQFGLKSVSAVERWRERLGLSKHRSRIWSHGRGSAGKRADLGNQFFRSSWEANYARYLNFLKDRGQIQSWEYEPDTFWFEKIKRGTRSYTPDFKVTEAGRCYYVEIKGWMDQVSRTKLERMARYYPNIEVRLIEKGQYVKLAAKIAGLIPHWESHSRRNSHWKPA